MKNLLLGIFGVTLAITAQSQDKTPKWSIESGTIFGGVSHSRAEQGTFSDFRVISPTSTLAARDFDGFSAEGGDHFRHEASGIRATFVRTNWKTTNRKLRMSIRAGLTNATITPINVTYERTTTGNYNTYSAPNGDQIQIDTAHIDVYKMDYHTKISTIDFGLQLNTNYAAKWVAYAGVVARFGLSYGSAEISQRVYTDYYATDEASRRFDIGTTRYMSKDNESNGSSFRAAYGLGIPIGVQYRISKTHKFFSKTRILFEFQPCLNAQHIEGFGMATTLYSTRTFGIQYDI